MNPNQYGTAPPAGYPPTYNEAMHMPQVHLQGSAGPNPNYQNNYYPNNMPPPPGPTAMPQPYGFEPSHMPPPQGYGYPGSNMQQPITFQPGPQPMQEPRVVHHHYVDDQGGRKSNDGCLNCCLSCLLCVGLCEVCTSCCQICVECTK